MNLLRLWLLVLLAVLLPVRGAMAAAMACPPGGMPAPQASAQAADHGHGAHAHDEAAHAPHDGAPADHAAAPGPDLCSMCSASCSTPPVPSAAAGLGAPVECRAAAFPDLLVPAPTFESGGQDRPPRTT